MWFRRTFLTHICQYRLPVNVNKNCQEYVQSCVTMNIQHYPMIFILISDQLHGLSELYPSELKAIRTVWIMFLIICIQ